MTLVLYSWWSGTNVALLSYTLRLSLLLYHTSWKNSNLHSLFIYQYTTPSHSYSATQPLTQHLNTGNVSASERVCVCVCVCAENMCQGLNLDSDVSQSLLCLCNRHTHTHRHTAYGASDKEWASQLTRKKNKSSHKTLKEERAELQKNKQIRCFHHFSQSPIPVSPPTIRNTSISSVSLSTNKPLDILYNH